MPFCLSSKWKISAYADERKIQHLSSNSDSPPPAKQSCKRLHRGRETCSPCKLSTGGKRGSQQHLRQAGYLGYIALLNTASATAPESPPQGSKATAAPQLIASTLWSTPPSSTFSASCSPAVPTSPLGPVKCTRDPNTELLLLLLLFFKDRQWGLLCSHQSSVLQCEMKVCVACRAPWHKST